MRPHVASLLLLIIASGLLPGCIAIGGRTHSQPTVADELKELRAARLSGDICEEEYNFGIIAIQNRSAHAQCNCQR